MTSKQINNLRLERLPASNGMIIELLEEVLFTILPDFEKQGWVREIKAGGIPQFVVRIHEASKNFALIEVGSKQPTAYNSISASPARRG